MAVKAFFCIYSSRLFIYFLGLTFNTDILSTTYFPHHKGLSLKFLTHFATERSSSWQTVVHVAIVKFCSQHVHSDASVSWAFTEIQPEPRKHRAAHGVTRGSRYDQPHDRRGISLSRPRSFLSVSLPNPNHP